MNPTQHKEQRVGVFVDIQNMYYSAKNLYGAKVDFGKILFEAIAGRKLVRAFAYVIKADVGAEQDFFDALYKIGYEVKEKELQIFYGGAKKGDWDVGLCMDVVRMIPKIDCMVLISGDGDYKELLEYARSQGVRTEVIAFEKTSSNRLLSNTEMFTDIGAKPEKFLIGKKKYSIIGEISNKIVKPTPNRNQNRQDQDQNKEQDSQQNQHNQQRNSDNRNDNKNNTRNKNDYLPTKTKEI